MPHLRTTALVVLCLALLVRPSAAQVAGDVSPMEGELDVTTEPPTWRLQGDGTVDVSDVITVLRSAVGLLQIEDARGLGLEEVLAEIARLDLSDDALDSRVSATEGSVQEHHERLGGLTFGQSGLQSGLSELRDDQDALQVSHDQLAMDLDAAIAAGGFGTAALARIDSLESTQTALWLELQRLGDEAASRALLHQELVERVDSLQAQNEQMADLLGCLERVEADLFVNACNLHVVNGTGSTETPNGLGSLILGYNEERGDGSDERSGSHVLVVGREQGFRGSGGIVAGRANDLNGDFASVLGGRENSACADGVSISGGVGVATSLADSHPSSPSAGNGACEQVNRAVVTIGVEGAGNVHGLEFTLRNPPGVSLADCQVAFAQSDCPAVAPAGPFAEEALQYVVNPASDPNEVVVLLILANPSLTVPAPIESVVRVSFDLIGDAPSLEGFELLETSLSDELGGQLAEASLVLQGLELQ